MMDWTDKHYRYFARLISRRTFLYTEMITTGAIIHGDRARFLDFNTEEHPIALQLGGSNPAELAECARIAEGWGYDEVNLNVGCPSDRVQNNMIGACLMAHPQLVADCVAAMRNSVKIPVTVKHRIGIDDQDSYEELCRFVDIVQSAGCETFIVHARKAILSGLSPKQNREIPPLRYDVVYQLKRDFPHLEILINGGIQTMDACQQHLQQVDGVMIGREAYQRPWMLSDVDRLLFNETQEFNETQVLKTRHDIVDQLIVYLEKQMQEGSHFWHIARHLLGLFHAVPGGKQFRRILSERGPKTTTGIDLFKEAVAQVDGALARDAQRNAQHTLSP
jgi:tRNA-dihydrouridine synthase A